MPGNNTNLAPGTEKVADDLQPSPDRTGGGCIQDGPFKHFNTNLGPIYQTAYNPRCIRRDFAYSLFTNASPARVSEAMAYPDFAKFGFETEGSIHISVHAGVGGIYGSIRDFAVSPGDPLFYMHHSAVDRAWWSWQKRHLSKRLKDFTGPLVAKDYDNSQAGNATLDTIIDIGGSTSLTASVRDVMDIRAKNLCYTYDSLW